MDRFKMFWGRVAYQHPRIINFFLILCAVGILSSLLYEMPAEGPSAETTLKIICRALLLLLSISTFLVIFQSSAWKRKTPEYQLDWQIRNAGQKREEAWRFSPEVGISFETILKETRQKKDGADLARWLSHYKDFVFFQNQATGKEKDIATALALIERHDQIQEEIAKAKKYAKKAQDKLFEISPAPSQKIFSEVI